MKISDPVQCANWYQALLDRASEYTGVFFVGVKTTGVFCISVCRARKPKRENVEFYSDMKSALMRVSGRAKCADQQKMPALRQTLLSRRLRWCVIT